MSENAAVSTVTVASRCEPGVENIVSSAGIAIERAAASVRLVLRGHEAARVAASSALGLDVSSKPCRASTRAAGTIAALWLGPDEWLLLSPPEEKTRQWERLTEALEPIAHGLVDVTDRQIGFEIAGSRAVELLGVGCPLDLDVQRFPVDACVRTLFAKCEIVLWRRSLNTFRVEIARSYEGYLVGQWHHAARALEAA